MDWGKNLLFQIKTGQPISNRADDAIAVVRKGNVALTIHCTVEVRKLYVYMKYCNAFISRGVRHYWLLTLYANLDIARSKTRTVMVFFQIMPVMHVAAISKCKVHPRNACAKTPYTYTTL